MLSLDSNYVVEMAPTEFWGLPCCTFLQTIEKNFPTTELDLYETITIHPRCPCLYKRQPSQYTSQLYLLRNNKQQEKDGGRGEIYENTTDLLSTFLLPWTQFHIPAEPRQLTFKQKHKNKYQFRPYILLTNYWHRVDGIRWMNKLINWISRKSKLMMVLQQLRPQS